MSWRRTPPAAFAGLGVLLALLGTQDACDDGQFFAGYGAIAAAALLLAFAARDLAGQRARVVAGCVAIGAAALVDVLWAGLLWRWRAGGGAWLIVAPRAPWEVAPVAYAIGLALPIGALVPHAWRSRGRELDAPVSPGHAVRAARLAASGLRIAAFGAFTFGVIALASLGIRFHDLTPHYGQALQGYIFVAAAGALAAGAAGLAVAGAGLVRLAGARVAHVRTANLVIGGAIVALSGCALALQAATVTSLAVAYEPWDLRMWVDSLHLAMDALHTAAPLAASLGLFLALTALGRYSRGPLRVEYPQHLDRRVAAVMALAFLAVLLRAANLPSEHRATLPGLALAAFAGAVALAIAHRICRDVAETLYCKIEPPVATARAS